MATESPSQLSPVVIHSTCAVTASVSFWAAYTSVVAIWAPLSLNRSAAAGRPTSWSMTRLPPKLVSTSTIPGGSVRTSPISAACSQPGTSRSAARARVRRVRGDEGDQPALVGHVHGVDAQGSPTRRPPPGGRAPRPRAPACHARGAGQLVEHRGHAAAGGVAQAVQRRAGGLQQRVHRRPQRAACRTRSSASSSNSPRASMIAVPCSRDRARQQHPVARRQRGGGKPGARVAAAHAGGADVHRVGVAALDHLGVAGHDLDVRRPSAAAAIASTSARRSSALRPSSSTSDSDSASGRAPDTARSLTVPLTASSPIEPPGKRIGLTTKESVVRASSAPSTSARRRRPAPTAAGLAKAGANRPSISAWVALPPAPWAIVMRSSRNLARLPRAVSMMPRIFCSRSEGCLRRHPGGASDSDSSPPASRDRSAPPRS